MAATTENEIVYAIISNIPFKYHSSDLRNYFSQIIEAGSFGCFHFRHRPEAKENATATTSSSNVQKTTCCVVRMTTSKLNDLIKSYHRKHWHDENGDSVRSLCLVAKIKVSEKNASSATHYKTRKEQNMIPEDRVEFTRQDLEKLPELHPPSVMPHGNVGTPTRTFLALIRDCKLPPGIINKLKLTFPATRSSRMYGCVPYDYGGDVVAVSDTDHETVVTATGHTIESEQEVTFSRKGEKLSAMTASKESSEAVKRTEKVDEEREEANKEETDSEEDCEDWERHEALHDDVTNKERNKERLFETELEVVWEKGGSGLVFYTDAQYWDEKEGDFDERTVDDWDVDMSVYYEPGAGDKDARDFVAMREEAMLRSGQKDPVIDKGCIGQFEKFSKGIGRRVLTRQGWRDGHGLGPRHAGMAEALENDGQTSKDKKGLGYHGEKLQRYGHAPKKRRTDEAIISTIYDDETYTDPPKTLLRRREPHHIKHRPHTTFVTPTLPKS